MKPTALGPLCQVDVMLNRTASDPRGCHLTGLLLNLQEPE